ncbi:MAG: response regulator [Anaerolineae bacterium]|nr:response regulator [Anaerolineae bacterium]
MGESKRVLVIDDEPDLAGLIAIFLKVANFDVVSACDGKQALQILEQITPDLVFCDLVMPNMNGIETVRAIRSDPRFRSIPIIMLSARGSDLDVERALLAGANDYIIKPFRGADIVAVARKYLEEQPDDALILANRA